MDNKPDIEEGSNSSGYDEKIAGQQALLDDLKKEYEKDPSAELLLQVDRRQDIVLHLRNLAKGEPKQRAKAAAELARESVLANVIVRPAG